MQFGTAVELPASVSSLAMAMQFVGSVGQFVRAEFRLAGAEGREGLHAARRRAPLLVVSGVLGMVAIAIIGAPHVAALSIAATAAAIAWGFAVLGVRLLTDAARLVDRFGSRGEPATSTPAPPPAATQAAPARS